MDTDSDPLHCGGCGEVCDSSEVCSDGNCTCDAGTERCGVACIDTDSDPLHCGGCDVRCGAEEVCSDGACAVQCDAGLVACAGSCVDTTENTDHCGGCDQPCVPSSNQIATCAESVCTVECAADWYDLDDEPGCETLCDPANPGDEVCDGEDNDCDGLVDDADDDYEPVDCPLQAGVCFGATAACADGSLQPCDALTYAQHALDGERGPYDPIFETWCDGVDNDCSGRADEDCCTPSDLPVAIPDARMPVGWNGYAPLSFLPLLDAPAPLAVELAIGQVGEEARVVLNLLEFPDEGGHAPATVLINRPLAVGADPVEVFDAVWNDGVVVFMRTERDGPLRRVVYDVDGVEQENVTLAEVEEEVGVTVELRATVLEDGSELVLIAASEDGSDDLVEFFVAELGEVAVVSGSLSGVVEHGQVVAVTQAHDARVGCTQAPALEPSIECLTLGSELRVSERTRIDGGIPETGTPRFVPDGADGYVLYLPTEDGTGVLETRIDEDGGVTQTPTAIATQEGVALTGALPNGDVGLVTARTVETDGDGNVEVSLTVPARGGSIVAQYRGVDAAPFGFVYGPDATYVVVRATGQVSEVGYGRLLAFRLSQDGGALCLEEL